MIRYHKVRLLKYGQPTLKKRALYYKRSLYEKKIPFVHLKMSLLLGPLHKERRSTRKKCVMVKFIHYFENII